MSRRLWVLVITPAVFSLFLFGVFTPLALAEGKPCGIDNKCPAEEICARVDIPRGDGTFRADSICFLEKNIPSGARPQPTNGKSVLQVCSLIPDSASRFPDSCKPAPTPPPGATNVQCKSDEVGVVNPATGLIAACTKKLPPSATVAPLTSQQPSSLTLGPSCKLDFGSIADFTLRTGAKAGTLFAADSAAGFLKNLSLFGFNIGGAFSPAERLSGFLLSSFLSGVFFGVIASLASLLFSGLLQFGIGINEQLTTNNLVLQKGFGIMLTLANMGFVVAIIVIALAMMLRRSEWGSGQHLLRLIIAAVLINFSLFLAGIFLNTSTKAIQAFSGGVCAGNLAYIFNIATIDNYLSNFIANASGGGIVGSIVSIMSIYFSAFLTLVGALTIAAIFLFLMIRYVVVTILLIFMPIAWLGLIFPKLQFPGLGATWSGWWQEFFKWILYGPLITFFLYLTSVMISNLNVPNAQLTAVGGPIQGIGQVFAVIAISLVGLFAAARMGGIGGGLLTAGLGGGLGFAAGQWSGLLQKQGLTAETRAKLSEGRWKNFHEATAGTLRGASEAPRLMFGKPLAQVGLRLPEVKKPTEGEKRVERAKQILNVMGRNPLAVLQLAPGDLTEFSRHGTEEDRTKIDEALGLAPTLASHLDPAFMGPLSPSQTKQRANYNRARQQISEMARKGEW